MRWLFLFVFLGLSIRDLLRPVQKKPSPNPQINVDTVQVWMVGHATMLINFYGTTILTDPVFGNWLPFPRRITGPGLQINQLPKIDIILLSHAHWDHFHVPSLRKLAHEETTLLISKQCSDLVSGLHFKEVVELSAGDVYTQSDISVTTYQPYHWGQRLPWEKLKRGYNAYVIEKNGKAVFFCGDSGAGPVFKEVGERHAIDIALLPIGAYEPDSFRAVHMNPEDAVRAQTELGARDMIPFHFGTFRLSEESLDEPVRWLEDLMATGVAQGVTILDNGQEYVYREKVA